MAYVDLNPIRAGIAATSDFTSVKERIEDRATAGSQSSVGGAQRFENAEAAVTLKGVSVVVPEMTSSLDQNRFDAAIELGEKAGWLAPIALDPSRKKVREKVTTRRASNNGCLSMTLDQYLKLLVWTGRQIRANKVAAIPKDCAPILERLELNAETWLDMDKHFRKRFRNEASLPNARQSFRTFRRQIRSASATT